LAPPAHERLVDSQLIETSRYHEVDQIVDGLGAMVEARGREDDRRARAP
jgi:hypothetical protein